MNGSTSLTLLLDFLGMSRQGFHAEGAEGDAQLSHFPPGPAEDAERGGEIAPPDP